MASTCPGVQEMTPEASTTDIQGRLDFITQELGTLSRSVEDKGSVEAVDFVRLVYWLDYVARIVRKVTVCTRLP